MDDTRIIHISSLEILTKAIAFAANKHSNQRRKNKDKSPYIEHPIRVMHLLSKSGINSLKILCAAVLHDTVEDTQTTKEELIKEFGEEIAKIVMEVTDDKSLPKVERKKQQIEHAKHTLSYEARQVKLADKLDNLSSIQSDPPTNWSKEEIEGYVNWCYAVCDNLKVENGYINKKLVKIFQRDASKFESITELNEFTERKLQEYYNFLEEKEKETEKNKNIFIF